MRKSARICATEGGPDACWNAHEACRRGLRDLRLGVRRVASGVTDQIRVRWVTAAKRRIRLQARNAGASKAEGGAGFFHPPLRELAMYDHELDRFKRDVHLVQYAIDRHGYQRVARKSSRTSHVLRHAASDDKIVVAREADGHWVYFSVRDDRDHGSIVDFIQRRDRSSLGQVRQELRQWLGTPRPDPGSTCRPATPTMSRDRKAATQGFAAAAFVDNSPYLNARGIRAETLQDPRFARSWKQDARGNVLFPHRDDDGLCGCEIKNLGFKGFSTGGTKAAWQSDRLPTDTTLIVTESAIDGLSYHQLHKLTTARYLSTAGSLSAHQHETLERIVGRLAPSTTVVAAVDADAGGVKLAAQVEALCVGHPIVFVRHSPDPARGKDWNEVLQRVEHDYIRSLPAVRALALGRGR
jgi:Toprim domain-containing protein/uncharacterized protein DUF3991